MRYPSCTHQLIYKLITLCFTLCTFFKRNSRNVPTEKCFCHLIKKEMRKKCGYVRFKYDSKIQTAFRCCLFQHFYQFIAICTYDIVKCMNSIWNDFQGIQSIDILYNAFNALLPNCWTKITSKHGRICLNFYMCIW